MSKKDLYKQELTAIAQKIGELEAERDEHTLVIETLEPLDPNRVAFRLVGGVLCQQTVQQVLPVIIENKKGIQNLMKQLGQTYTAKDKEMREQISG
jgi:prefoldin subunit 2